MSISMTEKEFARLQSNRAPKAAQPKAKAPHERAERTGLTSLLLAGWCNEYDSQMRMRLYRGAQSTAFYADEKAACAAARLLAEETHG